MSLVVWFISLFFQDLLENDDETDDASVPSTDPLTASHPEDVQNVVVKLEEVFDWEENNSQSSSSSTNGPITDLDTQNVEVKMEEISNWDEN